MIGQGEQFNFVESALYILGTIIIFRNELVLSVPNISDCEKRDIND